VLLLKRSGAGLLALLGLQSVQADELAVGSLAPKFTLIDQESKTHSLADYSGRWVILYFYPKDDTPGCTTEACNFRDNIYQFKAIGAAVVGISVDDVDSHKEFSEKYKLPFVILADPTGETADAYGVLRDWKLVQIASRQSFLVNPQGMIVKHYEDVDPDSHTQQVLTDLQALMAE